MTTSLSFISLRAVVLFVPVAVRFLRKRLAAKAAASVGPDARVLPHVWAKPALALELLWAKRTCIKPDVEFHRVVASARRLRILILFRFAWDIVRALSGRA